MRTLMQTNLQYKRLENFSVKLWLLRILIFVRVVSRNYFAGCNGQSTTFHVAPGGSYIRVVDKNQVFWLAILNLYYNQ